MLALHRVTRRFGRRTAVDDVSLEIERGQVVGVLGPNGAGKSTTVRMIAAVLPPTVGRLTVDGLDTLDRSADVRRRLGYLPEANPLHPEMTAGSYLRHRAGVFGLRGRAARAAADRAADRTALADVLGQRIGTLSKGYRQRVGLAAALLHDPPILILDEPTTGLDPSQIAETRSLIRDLAADHTTLLVSHILPEVQRTCDRILVFARGLVVADGSPDDLTGRASAGRCVLEARDPEESLAAELRRLPGVVRVTTDPAHDPADPWRRYTVESGPDADLREPIARLAADRSVLLRELRPERPTLESLYLRLTDAESHSPQRHRGGTEDA